MPVPGQQDSTVNVIDRLLWRNAQHVLARHASADLAGRCTWCREAWPCTPRQLGQRASVVAQQPALPVAQQPALPVSRQAAVTAQQFAATAPQHAVTARQPVVTALPQVMTAQLSGPPAAPLPRRRPGATTVQTPAPRPEITDYHSWFPPAASSAARVPTVLTAPPEPRVPRVPAVSAVLTAPPASTFLPAPMFPAVPPAAGTVAVRNAAPAGLRRASTRSAWRWRRRQPEHLLAGTG